MLPFADKPSAAADSSIRITEKLLAAMKQKLGDRLVVMLIPAPQAKNVQGRFAEICKAAGVACVDPTARFAAAGDSIVFPEDGHWNAAGHRLAASVLAEIVQAHRR